MMFVKLTRPDGSVLYLGQGISVEPVIKGQFPSGTKTMLTIQGSVRAVLEDPEEVVAKFEALVDLPKSSQAAQSREDLG